MAGIPLRTEPTDLRALLAGALEALKHQAEGLEVALELESTDELPTVELDAEKIGWAVATLVGNALRFVRHGTRRMPGGWIVVRLAREPDAVTIAVEDDGPGIPPQKAPWLFRRQPGRTHAAGLALMLVHDVVVAHGGTVSVSSETEGPNRGTHITLRLPLSASAASAPGASRERSST